MKRALLAIAAMLAPSVALAQDPGIGIGVSARGVVESQSVAGREYSRVYNVIEPSLDAFLPWQAMRIELTYTPLLYVPLQGDAQPWGEPETTVFHIGRGALVTTPLRGVELRVEDEMKAQPRTWNAPGDTSENLVQTNDARAAFRVERGRRFVLDAQVEGRRFDVFEGVVTETDRDADLVVDPEEDLNSNGAFDTELKPSFVEARAAPGLFRRIGKTSRIGLVGAVSARYFDELTRNDHVAVSGGIEGSRRVRTSLAAELRAVGTQYTFADGDPLTGWEGTAAISWQATRVMGFGLSAASRRAVDSFANRADTNDVAVSAFRDLARGSRLDVEGRYSRLRILTPAADDVRDVDAGMGSLRFSFPIRWGVRMGAGYRFWRGGGRGLQWTTDHLAFVGLSWE